jgi:hypothetical protein
MLTWQYIAGFFDGEGHVTMTHSVSLRSSHIEVGISQSQERGRALFSEIQEWLLPYGIECKIYRQKPRGTLKQMYHLDFTGRENYTRFLHHVFPHLHIKKVETQDMLRYLKLFPQKKYWLYQKGIPKAEQHVNQGKRSKATGY